MDDACDGKTGNARRTSSGYALHLRLSCYWNRQERGTAANLALLQLSSTSHENSPGPWNLGSCVCFPIVPSPTNITTTSTDELRAMVSGQRCIPQGWPLSSSRPPNSSTCRKLPHTVPLAFSPRSRQSAEFCCTIKSSNSTVKRADVGQRSW